MAGHERVRLAWAVSGQGRALLAVMDAVRLGLLHVDLELVILDRPSPIGAAAAKAAIPCHLIEAGPGRYHPRLVELLAAHRIDWLGLTFNRLISDEVIHLLDGRIFNFHLSLLPMFPGFSAKAIRSGLEHGMRLAGATVHLVNHSTDGGSILGQCVAPVPAGDTEALLGRRLFEASLPLLLQVVRSVGARELTHDARLGLRWPRAAVAPTGSTAMFPLVDEDLLHFAQAFCARLGR